jgi:hypothetical protein
LATTEDVVKTADMKEWVEQLLQAHGASVEARGQHCLQIHVPKELEERLGVKSMLLAFNQRGLQENPRSELAAVGNPAFDQILDLAQSSGRIGVRYARLPKGKLNPPKPLTALRLTNGSRGFSEPALVYTPIYECLFRVRTSADEVPDELEVISVDGLTEESEPVSEDLLEVWEDLDSDPDPSVAPPTVPVFPTPESIMARALAMLEQRLARRLSKLRRASEERLEKERKSINVYYEKLIQEAKTAPLRGGRGQESRDEKERVLKLDWKRRVEEAQGFWTPRVDVTLSGVGIVMKPRWSYLLQGKSGTAVYADPETRKFLVPIGTPGVTLLNS